jgi:hypothetical protein
MKYQYKVVVTNKEATEGVVVTHLARSLTEPEDCLFYPENCMKLHHDLIDRFRYEKGELLLWMQISRVDE